MTTIPVGLEDIIATLNPRQVQQLRDYALSLQKTSFDETSNKGKDKTVLRTGGGLQLLYMAEDFDETPECFAEYV